jgi:hypothetical protein
MKEYRDKYWIRFGDPKQSSSFTGNLAGKYLIFSKDQQLLITTAKYEIEHKQFKVAKVSINPNNKDYVLCLYWKDDSRRHELADRYSLKDNLSYRYWKSNRDTRARKYSNEYMRNKI